MASYHCNIRKPITAKRGGLLNKAAYNNRTQYRDERTGILTNDYSKVGGLLAAFITGPAKDMPDWMTRDTEKMLNESLKAMKRKDARQGQEVVVGFIDELGFDRNRFMLNDFVREQITRKTGHLCMVSVHAPTKKGDQRNYHAHIVMLAHKPGPDGFEKQLDDLNPNDYNRIREAWAKMGARELTKLAKERNDPAMDLQARIYRWGHLELPEQMKKALERGDLEALKILDHEAQKHMGPAHGMENDPAKKKQQRSHVGDQNRNIKEINFLRKWAKALGYDVPPINRNGPPLELPLKNIHDAWQQTKTPAAFRNLLKVDGYTIARVTAEDIKQDPEKDLRDPRFQLREFLSMEEKRVWFTQSKGVSDLHGKSLDQAKRSYDGYLARKKDGPVKEFEDYVGFVQTEHKKRVQELISDCTHLDFTFGPIWTGDTPKKEHGGLRIPVGTYVVIDDRGRLYHLNERTTGEKHIQQKLKNLEKRKIPGVVETREKIDRTWKERREEAAFVREYWRRDSQVGRDFATGRRSIYGAAGSAGRRADRASRIAGGAFSGGSKGIESLLAPPLTPEKKADRDIAALREQMSETDRHRREEDERDRARHRDRGRDR
jgi:MobA/MobL family